MKLLKKNLIFIIIIAILILCIITRNSELSAVIVSHPDSQLAFSTEQAVLEQTWQPHVKRVTAIRIPYVSTADFGSNMKLAIYSDDYSESYVQTGIYQDFRENDEGTLEFRFKTLKLTPGNRYRIQLSYEEPSGSGELLIASGTNYAGCSIDGEEYNEAAALEILFFKNSRLFWLFALFFPFGAFSLLCMIVWGRKWEDCIGLSMIAVVFILYVAGLFEAMMAGMVLVYILAAVSLFLSVYFYNKKDIQPKSLFSPAIIIYGILFLVILVNCNDVWFWGVDENSHWGIAVKDMFYYESFAKHMNTTVGVPRYVPFATLIEYFFIYTNEMFSQKLVYIAYQVTFMSVIIVICKSAGRKLRYYVPILAIIVGIPVIFHSYAYNSIWVDPLLGILAAYVLYCYYSEEMTGFNLLRIIGGLFALTTTKDMGMVIAGLFTVIMIGDRLYHSIRYKLPVFKRLILPCLCAVFVIVVYLSWQIYMIIPAKVTVSDTPKSENSQMIEETAGSASEEAEISEDAPYFQTTASATNFHVDEILGLFRGEDKGYRYQAVKNFIVAMFDGEMYFLGSIGVSYIDMLVLIFMLTGWLVLIKFWGDQSGRMLFFGIYTCVAAMAYALVLEFMSLFVFTMAEALTLASFERYLGTFLEAIVIVLTALIVKRAAENEHEKPLHGIVTIFGLTAAIIICVPIEGLVVKRHDVKFTKDYIYGYDDMAEVLRSFSVKGEKIYFICNGSSGDSYFTFINAACPLLDPYATYNLFDSEEAYRKQLDIWEHSTEEVREAIKDRRQIITCEKWEEELRDCQYVFIFHPNDVFEESYGSLFAEPDTIEDGTFYRVQTCEDKLTLEFIGKVGVKDWQ